MRIVAAGSGGSVQTVGVRRFTGMISSFLFRLSESESEREFACTIRVPIGYAGFRGGTLMFLHGNKQVAVFSQFAESIISEKYVCSFTFFSLSLIG
jgi:hypothetical protein